MFTICCTSKLLKRINLHPEMLALEPTTALGNWYANILYFYKRQNLMIVSENSRLAVITPAKDARSLANYLTQNLLDILVLFGVPSEWIEAEMREMADVHISTTLSRSVLGTMNDYKFQIEVLMDDPEEISPFEMAKILCECPVGPLQYRFPREVAIDLLKKRYL
jgi:hypothetical protein